MWCFSEVNGVGTSTIYGIKKQKQQILKLYSDVPKSMSVDVDGVLFE